MEAAAEALLQKYGERKIPFVPFSGDQKAEVLALQAANFGREEADMLGIAHSLRQALQSGASPEEIAHNAGQHLNYVLNHLALTDIPAEVAQRIAAGELPMSVARIVADLPEPKRTGMAIFLLANETAGVYSVWVRGMAPDAGGDSLHVGLDGQAPSTAADLTGFTSAWSWRRVTPGGNATLDLTETGAHTLDAWMREDGLRVDRLLLVTDTNYIPTGMGPAESVSQAISETVPGGPGTTSIAYQYDALYRLAGASYGGAITATYAYVYDAVGNMTAFTETVGTETTQVTRSFDAANRLQTALDLDAGTTSYYYDDNGNLVEILPPGATGQNPVGGLRYGYNQRNMLVNQSINPDGTGWVLQAEYVYDGGSDRLQQVDGNFVASTGASPVTTTYTNDVFGLSQVLVAGDDSTEVVNLFGLAPADLISQDSGSEVRTLQSLQEDHVPFPAAGYYPFGKHTTPLSEQE